VGFGLVIEFIEILQNVTTSNYCSIANSYALQFTREHIKYFRSAAFTSRCLVTASNAVASSASVFMPLLAGDCLPTN
jgi:hypothetical protein